MKTLALALVLAGLAISPVVKANEAAPAAAATKKEVKVADHKAAKAQARTECLKGNPGLKGKELHECVKSKLVK